MNKRIESAKKKPVAQVSNIQTTASEGAVALEDVNQLTSEKVQLELQYESTKSEMTSAQERINEVAARKKEMTVVSKIDGVVVKVNQNVAKTETECLRTSYTYYFQ